MGHDQNASGSNGGGTLRQAADSLRLEDAERYTVRPLRIAGALNGCAEILDTTVDGGEGEPLIAALVFSVEDAREICDALNARNLYAAAKEAHLILWELRAWFREGGAPDPSSMYGDDVTWKQVVDAYFDKAMGRRDQLQPPAKVELMSANTNPRQAPAGPPPISQTKPANDATGGIPGTAGAVGLLAMILGIFGASSATTPASASSPATALVSLGQGSYGLAIEAESVGRQLDVMG